MPSGPGTGQGTAVRVLVEVADRLGELVADIAAMQTMAAALPGCSIEVVASDRLSGVLEDCAFIHHRHLWRRSSVASVLAVNMAALAGDWDVFLEMRAHGVLRWTRPWVRAKVTRPPPKAGDRAGQEGMWKHRLGVLDGLVPAHSLQLRTAIPLLDGRAGRALELVGIDPAARFMTVAPGAPAGDRPWPESYAVGTVNALKGNFDRVLVLGRAADDRLCRRIAAATAAVPVAGNLPFPYALALISRAAFHLGTDNCMAQVAASFGVPTLCVGGPQGGYMCPWRQHQLEGDPEDIGIDPVVARMRELLQ